ncbi:hypothetical protein [Solibacillus sp. FSL H8-0538]|uniref:hypothetical protein n=1 Tax=Solibacillus sp. FSL H8-0538 TaxID=2921400 RepID=UPI0030F9D972
MCIRKPYFNLNTAILSLFIVELSRVRYIMKYGIKNRSQIKTWMKRYRNNELYRFDQPIGKQYSYGHGPEGLSETDKMNRKMAHLEMENEILKKFMAIEKELNGK